MGSMHTGRAYLILTNNPLVFDSMEGQGPFHIRYEPDFSLRQVLIAARDLVYLGHTLYTHPLSGSVKPNETPYKSIVLSRKPRKFRADYADLMGKAVALHDRFPPLTKQYTPEILLDFQRIDYSLVANAIDFQPNPTAERRNST